MKVIDLFCGAGGFSEGFRQAGFEIVCGIDIWSAATDTFGQNQSNSAVIRADIDTISKMPEDQFERTIPDSEIIIGSPPCIAFSNSNKSGKGDKTDGLILIEAFLRIVARKKTKKGSILKYWILENVAKAEPFIKASYTAKDLKCQGTFILQVKNKASGVYHAQYFGVPSKRKRYFCGEFPAPKQVSDNKASFKPLAEILNALGSPGDNVESMVTDPTYALTMKSRDVTDHHYVKEIAEFQWRKLKRLKEDKGYMGKMDFPENLNKLCRAIMATMTLSARESMVFPYHKGRYRSPTIREIASLMSFPLDYRFYARTKTSKHVLIGNAVPPKLSYAFAASIAEIEGFHVPEQYLPIKQKGNLAFHDLNFITFEIQIEKPKKPEARFKYHIPYLKINAYRVELTNYNSDFSNTHFKWDIEIHKSQGPKAKVYKPSLAKMVLPQGYADAVQTFLDEIAGRLTTFKAFQQIYCTTSAARNGKFGPEELLSATKDFILQLQNKYGLTSRLALKDADYDLPEAIAIGYVVLSKAIGSMRKMRRRG